MVDILRRLKATSLLKSGPNGTSAPPVDSGDGQSATSAVPAPNITTDSNKSQVKRPRAVSKPAPVPDTPLVVPDAVLPDKSVLPVSSDTQPEKKRKKKKKTATVSDEVPSLVRSDEGSRESPLPVYPSATLTDEPLMESAPPVPAVEEPESSVPEPEIQLGAVPWREVLNAFQVSPSDKIATFKSNLQGRVTHRQRIGLGIVGSVHGSGYYVMSALDATLVGLARTLFDFHVKTAPGLSQMPAVFNDVDIGSLDGCGFIPTLQHAMRNHAEYVFATVLMNVSTNVEMMVAACSGQLSLGPVVFQPARSATSNCSYVFARAFYRHLTNDTVLTLQKARLANGGYSRLDMAAELFYADDRVGIIAGSHTESLLGSGVDVVHMSPGDFAGIADHVTWVNVRAGQVMLYDSDVVRVFAGGETKGRRSRLFGIHVTVGGTGVPIPVSSVHLDTQTVASAVFDMTVMHEDTDLGREFQRLNLHAREGSGQRFRPYDATERAMVSESAVPDNYPDPEYWDEDETYPTIWQTENGIVQDSFSGTRVVLGENRTVPRITFPWILYEHPFGRLVPGDLVPARQHIQVLTVDSLWHPLSAQKLQYSDVTFDTIANLLVVLMTRAMRGTPVQVDADSSLVGRIQTLYTQEAVRLHMPDIIFMAFNLVANTGARAQLDKANVPLVQGIFGPELDVMYGACLNVITQRVRE